MSPLSKNIFFSLVPLCLLSSIAYSNEQDLLASESNESALAVEEGAIENESVFWLGATARLSPWLASWQQKSTAAKRFGRNALNVDYAIDQSIIVSASFSVRVKSFTFDLELIDKTEAAEQGEKALNYLSMGVNYSDLSENLSFELGYIQGSFDGFFSAEANNGSEGEASFSTELIVQDLLIIHNSGFGLGYRYMSYDLPQDVYLVHETNPNTVLLSGFENFEYTGHMAQALVRSADRMANESSIDSTGVNVSYEARAGLGLMESGGEYLATAENANGKLMDTGSVFFYEFDVAIYRNFDFASNRNARIDLGYRASFLSAKFDPDTEYSLVTDFETSFNGPYLSVAGSF